MNNTPSDSMKQDRWNQYGWTRLKELEEHPERFVITECPIRHKAYTNELLQTLRPVQGKTILELGSGRGEFAVWLAQQGATVTAIDIGQHLVAASQALAQINQVDCSFQQSNIVSLPFAHETFDVVLGLAVLHHLSEADVKKTLHECHRVLKTGGMALFHETVENSKVFDFLQNLFPAGKRGTHYYRPSILCRRAWKHYTQSYDDRAMTNREFINNAQGLFHATLSPYGFFVRLTRLIGNRHHSWLQGLDRCLFKIFPPLKHFSQTVLVTYRKKSEDRSQELVSILDS